MCTALPFYSLLQFYSLEAQLRALQLVFLQRSLDELMDYIAGKGGPLCACSVYGGWRYW